MSAPVLSVRGLTVDYRLGRRTVRALHPVDFELHAGRTLGIVGESGSGKSSLARALLRLVPCGGEVSGPTRALTGAVFQDPHGSLDPTMTVARIVDEPLRTHRQSLHAGEREAIVRRTLARVGIDDTLLGRRPHALSGGQCQRVAIARAIVLEPRLLVCDEPVSALDMVVRAQVLALLDALRRDTGVATLFISHDLGAVRRLAHDVLVLQHGRVVEAGPVDALAAPRHPYTRALLDAVPLADPAAERARRAALPEVPCPFPNSPPGVP